MTNTEYEAASIAAAGCYDRFEGEHKLKQWDEHIATLEAALAKAQEARREIVNQYNLNKCEHKNGKHRNFKERPIVFFCSDCGAKL